MASTDKDRFGKLNIDEVRNKEDEFKNPNSIKNEKKATEAFKAYLRHINATEGDDFFTFTEIELGKHLATFYWNAWRQKGEKYKASSLETLRYALDRSLKAFGLGFDITDKKSVSFQTSIKAFETVMKDLKQCGKGHVKQCKEITQEGKIFIQIFSIHNQYKLMNIFIPNICN